MAFIDIRNYSIVYKNKFIQIVMKSIFMILKKIRNQLPYLLLVVIYFFFVNLEARKETKNNKIMEKQVKFQDLQPNVDEIQRRVSIPVIPFE